MKIISGYPVSQGVAIGEAFVMETEGFRVPEQAILTEAIDAEVRRLHRAIDDAADEIVINRESTREALGRTFADIFEAQLQILLDPKLHGDFEERIRNDLFSAEHAVTFVMGKHINIFSALANSYIAEKVHDIRDIEKRLLRNLLGTRKETLGALTTPIILLATNLTPSETATLDPSYVKAFVTEQGGPGGHTAILASALEIPAIVGTGGFLKGVNGGDKLIVDGDRGIVIVNPDAETLIKYRKILEHRILETRIEDTLPAAAKDGTPLGVFANIEFPYEAAACFQRGADGIGLFRTEFLYLTRKDDPTEDEHFEAYKHVVETMQGRPVTIRTFDFGADKKTDRLFSEPEQNPALGLRGIRLALKRTEMFRCQLRAILRAGAFGDVRIMFPLVSTLNEFLRAKRTMLHEAMDELDERRIPFNRNIKVGMMVEVPSAVITLDHFCNDADFFSVGTNDLIQYSMAVDRGNSKVNDLFSAEHPAVLRLLYWTIRLANRNRIPVSLCGQMGGDPYGVVLLLGMGLRNMSCSSNNIARVKNICRRLSIADCKKITRDAMRMRSAADIQQFVKVRVHELLPDVFGKREE